MSEEKSALEMMKEATERLDELSDTEFQRIMDAWKAKQMEQNDLFNGDSVVSEPSDLLSEIILPLRVNPQALPALWKGGDCGACVLGGIFNLPTQAVYEQIQRAVYEDYYEQEWTEARSFTPQCMEKALRVAEKQGLATDIRTQPQHFVRERDYVSRCFGEYPEHHAKQWHEAVTVHLEAGYYAIVMVNMMGESYYSHKDDGTILVNAGDHWQIIVGARTRRVERILDSGTRTWSTVREVLTSCSSTRTPDEEWTEAADFIRRKGGFHPYFVRPARLLDVFMPEIIPTPDDYVD